MFADPTIVTQPLSLTNAIGTPATFSVDATGTPPLSYQWRKGSTSIAGATDSAYAIASVVGADAASYTVRITNGVGATVLSAAAVLSTPPHITVEPKHKTNSCGTTATFTVTATGSSSLRYQWYSNNVALAGKTTASCGVANVQATSPVSQYHVVVTNNFGLVTSASANLYLKPTITDDVDDLSIPNGSLATFCVVACGSDTLTYQWRKSSVNIVGATDSCYSVTANLSTIGNYSVVVSSPYGTDTSGTGTLTLSDAPAITSQPAPIIAEFGDTAIFTVTATGVNPLHYQWRKNGVAISGANASAHTISPVTSADAANYSVVITNISGTITSANAGLFTKPEITVQPKNRTNNCGENVTFGVTADGSTPLRYQWYSNNVAIPGKTASTCSVQAITPTDPLSEYHVVVTNAYGMVTSSVVNLCIEPSITLNPANNAACDGNPVSFCVSVCGSPTLTYQWTFNGVNISGATESCFVTNATSSSSGWYAVAVSNPFGNVTSGSAYLTHIPTAPTISTHPSSQTAIAGHLVQFAVGATGSGLSYHWYKDGVIAPGLNAATISFLNVDEADAGTYHVVVSNLCGTATSSSAVLTVTSPNCTSPTTPMLAWWKGENNMNDSSGNGYHGSGSPTYGAGLVTNAFYSGFTAGTTVGNFGTNDFSIELWMRPDGLRYLSSQLLVSKRDGCGAGPYFEVWYSSHARILSFYMSDDSSGVTNALGIVSTNNTFVDHDNRFRHIAAVRQGTNILLYVDGALNGSSSALPLLNITNAGELRVGGAGVSLCKSAFRGMLDEVTLYDGALSASEVADLYNAASAGKCTP